jgi:hypothetical protein
LVIDVTAAFGMSKLVPPSTGRIDPADSGYSVIQSAVIDRFQFAHVAAQ